MCRGNRFQSSFTIGSDCLFDHAELIEDDYVRQSTSYQLRIQIIVSTISIHFLML